MDKRKCLYCYGTLSGDGEFHETCSQKFFGSKKPPLLPYTFDRMADLAKNVVERSITVPGVQPKLSLSLVKEVANQIDTRLTVIGALGGNYILKPPSTDFEEMPANEHVTMRIAEAFGINVVSSSLIRLQSGELSYITKRIDRSDEGKKVHMLDMFQITEAFDKYKSSMEKVVKAVGEYSSNPLLDKLFVFEIALFCFLFGNNDMHLKNFSMILTNGTWKLAPAYDLLNVAIVLPDDDEELALSMGGKKRKFNISHFEAFGIGMGLNAKQINGVFKRFLKNKPNAVELIGNSFLSEKISTAYINSLKERYKRLYP